MNPDNLCTIIRKFIGSIAWKVFIWGSCMTEQEYLTVIYNQEKERIEEI